MRKFALLCLLTALLPLPAFSQNNYHPAASTTTTPASSHAPSAAEIAAARASREVWVNLGSGIYHKGGRWYGKTKSGKFLSEADARKAGYKHAKRD